MKIKFTTITGLNLFYDPAMNSSHKNVDIETMCKLCIEELGYAKSTGRFCSLDGKSLTYINPDQILVIEVIDEAPLEQQINFPINTETLLSEESS